VIKKRMIEFPKIYDKVILKKEFKESAEYREFFPKRQIQPLIGKECTVVGMSAYTENELFVIITRDRHDLFNVRLQWIEPIKTEKER